MQPGARGASTRPCTTRGRGGVPSVCGRGGVPSVCGRGGACCAWAKWRTSCYTLLWMG